MNGGLVESSEICHSRPSRIDGTAVTTSANTRPPASNNTTTRRSRRAVTDRAEGEHSDPQIDQQHDTPMGMPDLQQSVVQVHLVGAERRNSGTGSAHDRE